MSLSCNADRNLAFLWLIIISGKTHSGICCVSTVGLIINWCKHYTPIKLGKSRQKADTPMVWGFGEGQRQLYAYKGSVERCTDAKLFCSKT